MNRVNRVSHEVFNALGQLRAAGQGAAPVPDILHARLKAFVERAMRTAAELGFGQHDVHDIGYVLAALSDEVVLSLGMDTVRDFWLPRALQLQLFNENIAGEGVFQRLEALMSDPSRAEVLRIYYAALLFGFQGKYRVRGGEIELADTTERAAHALRQFGGLKEVPLSPSATMTREKVVSKGRQFPIVWLSAGILLVTIGLFAVMLMVGQAQVDALVQDLERSDAPAGTGQ
jgi:type VI secretion system protein ImpK